MNLALNYPGGNVGVGTSTPFAKLQVEGGSADRYGLWVRSSYSHAIVANHLGNGTAIYGPTNSGRDVDGWANGIPWLRPSRALVAPRHLSVPDDSDGRPLRIAASYGGRVALRLASSAVRE